MDTEAVLELKQMALNHAMFEGEARGELSCFQMMAAKEADAIFMR
jgi:hypothetical protein